LKNVSNVIELVNIKFATSGLKKQPIASVLETQNGKIRVKNTDGSTEEFGSKTECIKTLDAKYNLKLFKKSSFIAKQIEEDIFE
jgi:hypothetical protein